MRGDQFDDADEASLYEPCGRLRGLPGSVTVLPVLSMPAGDITHPVPDLTGYITEGQIVLSRQLHARGVHPTVEALTSLSRPMRRGVGPGRTRAGHLDVAAQLLSALVHARQAGELALARARQVRELADLVGQAALSPADRCSLAFEDTFTRGLLYQRRDEPRTLDQTLERAGQVRMTLPRGQLTMLSAEFLDAHRAPESG
ncbi:hypothetical protein [Streptomyces griseorubiginosus]|uniref:ATP synthase beta subunit C-terminal domain-containing protein n=1 Tax=Streptomyces griseorubiginosus TaxID=67304 RepID=UPI0036530158